MVDIWKTPCPACPTANPQSQCAVRSSADIVRLGSRRSHAPLRVDWRPAVVCISRRRRLAALTFTRWLGALSRAAPGRDINRGANCSRSKWFVCSELDHVHGGVSRCLTRCDDSDLASDHRWVRVDVGSAFDECLIVVVHGRKLRIERSESDSSGSMRRLTRPGSPPLSPSGAGPLTGTESSDQYRTCRPRRELSVNLSTRSTGVFGSNRYTSSDPNGVSNRSAQYPTGFEVGIQACGSAESSARPLTIKVPSYKFEDWQLLAAIPLGALQTAPILIAAVISFSPWTASSP